MTRPSTRTRILLVSDHGLVREGLRSVLKPLGHLEVGGIAAVSAGWPPDPSSGRVDLLVLHQGTPPDFDRVARLVRSRPEVPVLVVCDSDAPECVARGVHAGAAAVLHRDAPPETIRLVVRAALQGLVLMPRANLPESLRALGTLLRGHALRTPPAEGLTQRETEVLRLICEGASNHAIAACLGVAPSTVKKHVHTVMGKLGAPDRAAAAVRAIRLGLLD